MWDLFQVLGSFGVLMTDDQFKELTERVGFMNGYMNYSDFVMAFEDPRAQGPGDEILRVGNHRVNPIRGDEWGMTADEVEAKLRSKLRENFAVSVLVIYNSIHFWYWNFELSEKKLKVYLMIILKGLNFNGPNYILVYRPNYILVNVFRLIWFIHIHTCILIY